jgi:hypothetical protein
VLIIGRDERSWKQSDRIWPAKCTHRISPFWEAASESSEFKGGADKRR